MRTQKWIEVTYRQIGNRYVFASTNNKILIVSTDAREAASLFIRLIRELRRNGTVYCYVPCRVEAYAPLGPALKMLRSEGVICRVGLHDPPPMKPVSWQMPGMNTLPTPPPVYGSWDDYLARSPKAERMVRCARIAAKANRKRLLSDAPKVRITGQQVWAILANARGRCVHCGSLAVEGRPSNPVTGAPVAWAQVGRRIGSLEHVNSRFTGGDNDLANLVWSCLWCNTWPRERRRPATDHGGHYPEE
jgi:hypothetical protein